MQIKNLSNFLIIFAVIGSSILIPQIFAQNQDAANIQYPVAELGDCADKTACKTYCDNSDNLNACLNFAEKNKLMSTEELNTAKKFAAAGNKGPGNCRNKDECEMYCNDMSRIDECVSFADANKLLPDKELAEIKKIQAAIKRGVKAPPCKNKKECDNYCEDSNHMEECITFAAEAGFMQGKELEDAQKMLVAIKKGVKPPPCKGKEACDAYCQTPDNMEICMNFAMEAGFMNEEEKVNSQKMLTALKKGVKPPACNGKEACDAYCGQEEHFEECTKFAEAAGFMTAEEATMARKTGGKGPGDCKGKEKCEAFCNNSDNQETCFNFAKDNGMISEKDLKNMEEGKQQFKKSFDQMPQTVLDCLNSLLGADMVEKLKSGAIMPPKEIGDQMKTCFEKNMPQGPKDGQMPPACQTPEECKSYCQNYPDKCQDGQPIKFQPGPGAENPGGQTMPPQAGPGGCKTREECQIYCQNNSEECANFKSSMPAGQFQPGIEQGGQSYPNEQMPPQGQMQPYQGEQQPNQPGMGMPGQPPTEGNMPYQDQSQQQTQQMPPQGEQSYQGEQYQQQPMEQNYQQPPAEQMYQQPPPSESSPTTSAYPTLGQFFGGILYFLVSSIL